MKIPFFARSAGLKSRWDRKVMKLRYASVIFLILASVHLGWTAATDSTDEEKLATTTLLFFASFLLKWKAESIFWATVWYLEQVDRFYPRSGDATFPMQWSVARDVLEKSAAAVQRSQSYQNVYDVQKSFEKLQFEIVFQCCKTLGLIDASKGYGQFFKPPA